MSEAPKRENDVCPECGSSQIIQDHARGAIVCQDCGCVIEERLKDRGPEWRSFTNEQKENRSRVGSPITLMKHDKGLSTKIARSNKDAKGKLISPKDKFKIWRMKKWDRRSKMEEGGGRTLNHSLSCISRVCSLISPSSNVEERASYLYRKAMNADIVRGRRSEAVVGATIYIACVEQDLPVSLEKITEAVDAGVTRKEIQGVHLKIIRELRVSPTPIGSERYVPSILESIKLAIGKRTDMPSTAKVDALEIISKVDQESAMQSRSQITVAVAATLLPLLERGFRIFPSRVADSLGLTGPTVINAIEDLKNIIDFSEDKSGEGEKND